MDFNKQSAEITLHTLENEWEIDNPETFSNRNIGKNLQNMKN